MDSSIEELEEIEEIEEMDEIITKKARCEYFVKL